LTSSPLYRTDDLLTSSPLYRTDEMLNRKISVSWIINRLKMLTHLVYDFSSWRGQKDDDDLKYSEEQYADSKYLIDARSLIRKTYWIDLELILAISCHYGITRLLGEPMVLDWDDPVQYKIASTLLKNT
jgi:hypothetical protein